ncbi:hypothetical protein TrST_g10460 [Triparma strigata]|uniref:ADP,ATP carrier protein n=1 Tax=Triparma strigata TaxID=1606541 RepID=A0A9W7B4P8_9STRA|nr:hypothetical protein TrST_g10460 [Triparma strigata]
MKSVTTASASTPADSDSDSDDVTARTSLLGASSTPSKDFSSKLDSARHAKFANARGSQSSHASPDYRPGYHLGVLLSLHLSTFWLLDSLKDPILTLTTGIESQPTAKMYSIAFTLLTTYLYNLFQETNRNRLFHCLLYLYSSLFALLSLISPTRSVYTSYLNFLLTESYGSLVTAHFWGFCNAHVEFQDRVYPIIIGMAQIGAMLGGFGASGGDDISRRYFVGGCLGPIAVSISLYIYESKYSISVPGTAPQKSHDVWRGLKLIRKEPYLHLVLLLSTVYEVTLTVLDYLLKLLSIRKYSTPTGVSVSSLTTFLGGYAAFVNLLSFLLSVFVFERLLRRFGFKMSLTVYPCLLIFVTLLTFTSPSLWLVFVSMGLLKSLAYSVNDPLKELLYGVTTNEVKFGCKSWIDVLGSRIAKGVGSMLTGSVGGDERKLVQRAALPCLVAGILLAGASVRVGEMREEIGSRKVGEGEEEDEERNQEIEYEENTGIEMVKDDDEYNNNRVTEDLIAV